MPVWVCHAGYRHAVFVATLSEANRLRPDWNTGDEETPELDAYRCNFVDFANFFADDMFGTEFVHRRIKTREIFDLASEAYVDMRRAAHRAKAAADAAASSDSDDDDDVDDSPPSPPRRRPTSSATPSAADLDDGAGRPGAASCVAAPTHGRPPDTAAAAADAAAALVSASARVRRAVVEHEQATCGPPDPSTTAAHGPDPLRLPGALGGVGRPGAASCVAAPTHGRPPDAATASADAAAVLVSAPARVPRAVADLEQTSSALTSYHSGRASPSAHGTPPPDVGEPSRHVKSSGNRRQPPRRRDLCAAGDHRSRPAAREGTRGAVGQAPLGFETPASYEASADPDARCNPSHGGGRLSSRGDPLQRARRGHQPSRGPTIPV